MIGQLRRVMTGALKIKHKDRRIVSLKAGSDRLCWSKAVTACLPA